MSTVAKRSREPMLGNATGRQGYPTSEGDRPVAPQSLDLARPHRRCSHVCRNDSPAMLKPDDRSAPVAVMHRERVEAVVEFMELAPPWVVNGDRDVVAATRQRECRELQHKGSAACGDHGMGQSRVQAAYPIVSEDADAHLDRLQLGERLIGDL